MFRETEVKMNAISELLKNYKIPPVAKVRQTFNNDELENVAEHLRLGLEENCAPIKAGDRIAFIPFLASSASLLLVAAALSSV